MKHLKTMLIGTALIAAAAAAGAAQYHDSKLLMGGYASTGTMYTNGFWVGDPGAQTYQHVTPMTSIYYSRSIEMDGNNRDAVFVAEGTTSTTYASYLRSGIYRLNPNTGAVSTIYNSTLYAYAPRRVIVNQDGDYVFANYGRPTTSTLQSNVYSVMKVDQGSSVTTIFSSVHFGNSFTLYGLGRDIDTGHYLVNLYQNNVLYYGVLRVAEDGTFTTFAGGPTSTSYGWYGYYSKIEQDFTTGNIVGHYLRNLYELQKGSMGPRTTLWQLGIPGGFTMRYGSLLDTQSAATPRIIATGYVQRPFGPNNVVTYFPCQFTVDMKPPYTVTATEFDPANTTGKQYHYSYASTFYRGRHVQPAKISNQKWQVLFSCPRYANKPYIVALGMSGVRPAIPLPDGRRVHLLPDVLTPLSINNQLTPFFKRGPGVLNGNGEAVGELDLSSLGQIGVPLWMQLVVLDPQAPTGIAYIPDPYVIRI